MKKITNYELRVTNYEVERFLCTKVKRDMARDGRMLAAGAQDSYGLFIVV